MEVSIETSMPRSGGRPQEVGSREVGPWEIGPRRSAPEVAPTCSWRLLPEFAPRGLSQTLLSGGVQKFDKI